MPQTTVCFHFVLILPRNGLGTPLAGCWNGRGHGSVGAARVVLISTAGGSQDRACLRTSSASVGKLFAVISRFKLLLNFSFSCSNYMFLSLWAMTPCTCSFIINLIDAADITYFLWGIGLIVGHIDVALWFLWSKSMWTNAVVGTNPIMEEAIIHVHPTSRETAGERVMHTCKAESGRVRRRGCQTGRSLTNNCWGGIHFIPLLTVNDL